MLSLKTYTTYTRIGRGLAVAVLCIAAQLLAGVSSAYAATNLVSNPTFDDTSNWTSSTQWQTCSGSSGSYPCVGSNTLKFSRLTNSSVYQIVNLGADKYTSLAFSVDMLAPVYPTFQDTSRITLEIYGASSNLLASTYWAGPAPSVVSHK